jgi:hypothetical protein
LSEFLFVRDRDRRVIDDRWNSRREGLLVGALRSVGLAEREMRFCALQTVASLRLPPLVSRTRAPFPPARVVPRLRIRLVNLFFSPVVKYHGLGRATGFGDLRPCHTLGSLLDVASTAASAVDWLDSPERAGLRSHPFKLATLRPASSERPSRLCR